ncbi:hypothetical protein J7F04_04510 [Streptomyces sp. ISL-24]|nr:hypothetical protein [Streptomyces sp. ISL-24]
MTQHDLATCGPVGAESAADSFPVREYRDTAESFEISGNPGAVPQYVGVGSGFRVLVLHDKLSDIGQRANASRQPDEFLDIFRTTQPTAP